MSIRRRLPSPLWMLACYLAGCGDSTGGSSVPGGSQSGLRTQGQKMQGTRLQSIRLLGGKLAQMDIANLTLQGTSFAGTVGQQTVSGTGFIGAQLQAVDAAGATLQVTIQDITKDPQDPTGETLLYSLQAKDMTTGSSQDACDADADGVRLAIPVSGTWSASGAHLDSTSEFSFGCTSGVIAKCVRWGYRPWQSVGQQPLSAYHQICTRLARADYCGDGQTHTQEGTLVDVYDDLRVLTPVPDSGLLFDAAWTANGAYCIKKERWLQLQNLPSFHCSADFANLELVEPDPAKRASPVNSSDQCLVRRNSLSRDAVHLDNRSGLNVAL